MFISSCIEAHNTEIKSATNIIIVIIGNSFFLFFKRSADRKNIDTMAQGIKISVYSLFTKAINIILKIKKFDIGNMYGTQ